MKRAVREEFEMSNSFTKQDLVKAPSFAPQPQAPVVAPQIPMAHNDNPQMNDNAKDMSADPAQMVAVQAAEMSIFSFGMAAFDGGTLSFAHAAATANDMMNVAQTAEIGAATMDLGRTPSNPNMANNEAMKATQITQQAAFKPSTETTSFSTRSVDKKHSFSVSYKPSERPSDTDGMRTRGVDLSMSMKHLAKPFNAPTLSPR